MSEPLKMLIVDDEKVALKNLQHVMKKEGYAVTGTQSGQAAIKLLEEQTFDIVLTDLKMEKVDGMEVMKRCLQLHPDTIVIMITGFATLDSAVAAMKQGAYNYISKPFKLDELRQTVKEAAEDLKNRSQSANLRAQADAFSERVKLLTQDPAMLRILETARKTAPSDCPVLIKGEAGTGKELLARFIHSHSRRSAGPFVVVHCAAMDSATLDTELFGPSEETTNEVTPGRLLKAAEGGTLFLSEITAIPLPLQIKLKRVIAAADTVGSCPKEGTAKTGKAAPDTGVRVIATTDADILETMKTGLFRQDLFYRLNATAFDLPPLSARKEDIPLISYHFLKKFATATHMEVSEISREVLAIFMNYNFPGNVGELESLMERAVALSTGQTIEPAHLPDGLKAAGMSYKKRDGGIPSLEEQEMSYISWVMKEMAGNKSVVARILGIDRVSLWRKLKKYGLE